jgi:hypothetical protein
MNMWGFVPEMFAGMWQEFSVFLKSHSANPKAEYYIPLGIDALIRQGREQIRVLRTSSKWFGVTYQEDKPRVQDALLELVRSGEYPERLWNGYGVVTSTNL